MKVKPCLAQEQRPRDGWASTVTRCVDKFRVSFIIIFSFIYHLLLGAGGISCFPALEISEFLEMKGLSLGWVVSPLCPINFFSGCLAIG